MNLGDGWHASIFDDFQRDRQVLRIGRPFGPGGTKREYLCSNGSIHIAEMGEELPVETMWPLPTDSLQTLMDAMWDRGIRPKARRYEEESKLLREALDDARGLIAKLLPAAIRKPA